MFEDIVYAKTTPTNITFVNEANEAAEVLRDYLEMHLATPACDRKAHRRCLGRINDNFETHESPARNRSVSERGYSVRNRANTSPRDEAAFINGGTASLDNTKKSSDKSSVVSKAKPVSISFFEENLKDIDALITAEMVSGKGRVNRSDVVRAAVEALKTLSKTEVSRLIAEVKQR